MAGSGVFDAPMGASQVWLPSEQRTCERMPGSVSASSNRAMGRGWSATGLDGTPHGAERRQRAGIARNGHSGRGSTN